MNRYYRITRRKFLQSTAAMGASCVVGDVEATDSFRARPPKPTRNGRKPIALITTVYRPMSHAFHIGGRFIHGYARSGRFHVPKHYLHSMYVDQRPGNDLSRELSKEHRIRNARSIADALMDDKGNLAVEGVLLIAEHGNYPRNDRGQVLYPRHRFLKEIVEVFEKAGESVPVFNDKHLSTNWSEAKEMVEWSQDYRFGLQAGSALPVTWRKPELEIPRDTAIEDGLVAGYGPLEIYGFHGLETLQAMMERRQGGETGVKAVTCLTGKEVWRAGDTGRWSWDLLEAALGRSETIIPGDIRKNVGSMPVNGMPKTPPIAFLIEYRDGTRGTVLLLNGHMQDFCFAVKVKGEEKPTSCLFHLPPAPGSKYFDALVMNIEKLFETGKSPYPVERTLLTSGILAQMMESNQHRGTRIETGELEVQYQAPDDSGFIRGSISSPL